MEDVDGVCEFKLPITLSTSSPQRNLSGFILDVAGKSVGAVPVCAELEKSLGAGAEVVGPELLNMEVADLVVV